MRVALSCVNKEFSEYLQKCGSGEINLDRNGVFQVEVPEELCHQGDMNT